MPEPNVSCGDGGGSRVMSKRVRLGEHVAGRGWPSASDGATNVPGGEQDVAVLDVLAGEPRRAAHRAEVAHRLLDRPRRQLRPLGEQLPTGRGARRTGPRAQPSWLRVVSVPADDHGLDHHHQLVGATAGRPPPRPRSGRSSRSSAGFERRSSISARAYSSSSSCGRMIDRQVLPARLLLKIRRMSVGPAARTASSPPSARRAARR